MSCADTRAGRVVHDGTDAGLQPQHHRARPTRARSTPLRPACPWESRFACRDRRRRRSPPPATCESPCRPGTRPTRERTPGGAHAARTATSGPSRPLIDRRVRVVDQVTGGKDGVHVGRELAMLAALASPANASEILVGRPASTVGRSRRRSCSAGRFSRNAAATPARRVATASCQKSRCGPAGMMLATTSLATDAGGLKPPPADLAQPFEIDRRHGDRHALLDHPLDRAINRFDDVPVQRLAAAEQSGNATPGSPVRASRAG